MTNQKINRDMPPSNHEDFTDGVIVYQDMNISKDEMRFWLWVILEEEPERQNWQTMLTVIDGKEIVVCNN